MRRKERTQHYLVRDQRRQLRVSAAALGVTESALIEAALAEYFDRERTDKDWLARRLDLIAQGISQLQSSGDRGAGHVTSDADLLFETVGVFVRHVFLPAINPGANQEQRVEAAYETFLRRLIDQLREGGKLKRELRAAGAATAGRGPRPPSGGR